MLKFPANNQDDGQGPLLAVQKSSWQTGTYVVCSAAGYVLYLAWFFCIFSTKTFSHTSEASLFDALLLHLAFFAAVSLTLALVWRFADRLSAPGRPRGGGGTALHRHFALRTLRVADRPFH
jgi:hypothetical protein